MLFFSMWLPLGARASLDARRRGPPSHGEVEGVACVAATAQLAIVYLAGLAHKRGPTWRDGSAVYYALQLDEYTTPLGRWIGDRPAWSPMLTYGTLALELVAPLLLFVPWRRSAARVAAVATGIALHAGMLALMRLDLFPWIMFACWVLFLPAPFWDACARITRIARVPAAPTPAPAHDRRWGPLLAGALGVILVWNADDLSDTPTRTLGAVLRPLGLAQRWSMFAPDPARDDGWLVAAGRLADGSEVDLLNGGTPATGRPHVLWDLRWRSYLALVARDVNGTLTPGLLGWLCAGEPRAEHVTLLFEGEHTMPPGEPPLRESALLADAPCKPR
jgi:hypothetical protein